MMRFLVILAAAAAIAAAVRNSNSSLVRRDVVVRSDEPTPEPTPAPPTPAPVPIESCEDITDITLRGQDWTDVCKTVCTVWPTELFGPFPASTIQGLTNMLQTVFNEGGMWDQMTVLLNERSGRYCLRQEVTRTIVTSLAAAAEEPKECPPILSDEVLEEMPDEVEVHRELLDGYWACGKGGAENKCDCRRRDGLVDNEVYPVVSISSRPVGCQMVHQGQCYGACPAGFRPTFLTGWFRPVCTSICAETNFPVTCGVGCANTRSDCVSVIMNQVKEVAIAASKVAAFFMGGAGAVILHTTVEQVVRVAEFGVNVLGKVLEIADSAFKQFSREEAELATLVSLFQVLREAAVDVAKDWVQFQGLIRESSKLFVQLIDAEFGWKNVNLGWISGAIMKGGVEALSGGFEVARAFAYAECELATNEVAFTIENVGDLRVIGAWSQDGTTNDKPRFRLIRDRANTVLEWSKRANSWSLFFLDASFGRGWWFGWIGLGWRELYTTQANTPGFPTTGWTRVEGPLPLPQLVSTTNGGE